MEIGGIWKAFLEDRPQLSMHLNESLLLASTIDELTFRASSFGASDFTSSPPRPCLTLEEYSGKCHIVFATSPQSLISQDNSYVSGIQFEIDHAQVSSGVTII